MKKIVLVLMAIFMLMSLSGCSGNLEVSKDKITSDVEAKWNGTNLTIGEHLSSSQDKTDKVNVEFTSTVAGANDRGEFEVNYTGTLYYQKYDQGWNLESWDLSCSYKPSRAYTVEEFTSDNFISSFTSSGIWKANDISIEEFDATTGTFIGKCDLETTIYEKIKLSYSYVAKYSHNNTNEMVVTDESIGNPIFTLSNDLIARCQIATYTNWGKVGDYYPAYMEIVNVDDVNNQLTIEYSFISTPLEEDFGLTDGTMTVDVYVSGTPSAQDPENFAICFDIPTNRAGVKLVHCEYTIVDGVECWYMNHLINNEDKGCLIIPIDYTE